VGKLEAVLMSRASIVLGRKAVQQR
jgi:hypothetical protein